MGSASRTPASTISASALYPFAELEVPQLLLEMVAPLRLESAIRSDTPPGRKRNMMNSCSKYPAPGATPRPRRNPLASRTPLAPVPATMPATWVPCALGADVQLGPVHGR